MSLAVHALTETRRSKREEEQSEAEQLGRLKLRLSQKLESKKYKVEEDYAA